LGVTSVLNKEINVIYLLESHFHYAMLRFELRL